MYHSHLPLRPVPIRRGDAHRVAGQLVGATLAVCHLLQPWSYQLIDGWRASLPRARHLGAVYQRNSILAFKFQWPRQRTWTGVRSAGDRAKARCRRASSLCNDSTTVPRYVPRVGVSWAGVLSRFLNVQHMANTAGGQLGNPRVPYGERLLSPRQQAIMPGGIQCGKEDEEQKPVTDDANNDASPSFVHSSSPSSTPELSIEVTSPSAGDFLRLAVLPVQHLPQL